MDVDLGRLVRDARRAAGLSQARLARAAGTSQAMVARYETGAATPSVPALTRLLRAAGRDLIVSSHAVTTTGSASRLLDSLRLRRADILAAGAAVGAHNVRVFGSAARGEDTAHSDVDLLVDFPVVERGLLPLLQLGDAVSRLIGRDVDVATPGLLTDEARSTALAQAIPL